MHSSKCKVQSSTYNVNTPTNWNSEVEYPIQGMHDVTPLVVASLANFISGAVTQIDQSILDSLMVVIPDINQVWAIGFFASPMALHQDHRWERPGLQVQQAVYINFYYISHTTSWVAELNAIYPTSEVTTGCLLLSKLTAPSNNISCNWIACRRGNLPSLHLNIQSISSALPCIQDRDHLYLSNLQKNSADRGLSQKETDNTQCH